MKLALLLLLVMCESFAHAIDEETIFARHLEPIIPIGGVLYVPLYSTQSGRDWPEQIELRCSSGEVIIGHLGWIEPNPLQHNWTSESHRIRPIKPTDSLDGIRGNDAQSGPILLAALNESTFEFISFGECTLKPKWIQKHDEFPQLNIHDDPIGQHLSKWSKESLPEHNPLSMWRWSLIASSRNQQVPELDYSSRVEELASKYTEQLWKSGFNRLAAASRGVAASCRDLLTFTAFDGTQQFACWVTNQKQLNMLIGVMAEETISDEECSARCLAWSENQKTYLYWIEQLFGDAVQIAFANPTLMPVIAALTWQEVDCIPMAVEVPPRETERLSYEREARIDPSLFGVVTNEIQIQWLTIQLGVQATSQPFVPEVIIAKTPGVMLPECLPSWSLNSIRKSVPEQCSPHLRTTAELRKALGKWELFVSCAGFSESAPPALPIREATDVQGVEAVTIFHKESKHALCITPSHGTFQEPSGCSTFVTTTDYGWNARVELPDSWIANGILSISVVRAHGDSNAIETTPLPCVPWQIEPTYIEIDLTQWDKIQNFPVQLPANKI